MKSTISLSALVERASALHHGKYLYDAIDDEQPLSFSSNCYIPITCPDHGIFKQRISDHLRGRGCKLCASKISSRKATDWLTEIAERDNIHIQHGGNGCEFYVPEVECFVDGYCKQTNTVYEFDGDAFHGNPSVFRGDEHCHPFDRTVTASELLIKTLTKHSNIINAGYNLVTIWESQYDDQKHSSRE